MNKSLFGQNNSLCTNTEERLMMAKINNFSFTSIITFFFGDDCKKGKKKSNTQNSSLSTASFFSEVSFVWHKTIFRETKWKATNENRVLASFVGYHSLPRRKMQSMRITLKTKQSKKCFLSWRTSSTKLYQIK